LRSQLLSVFLAVNLIISPTSPQVLQASVSVIDTSVRGAIAPFEWLPTLVRGLSGSPQRRAHRKTQAQRISDVGSIRSISPHKHVAYQNEATIFTALAADSAGVTVQGVPFGWSSSDTNKLEIDNTGAAVAKNPGLVWVTASAGGASLRAPVLIKPGARPSQAHEQFDSDQSRLAPDGTVTGGTTGLSDQSEERLAGAPEQDVDHGDESRRHGPNADAELNPNAEATGSRAAPSSHPRAGLTRPAVLLQGGSCSTAYDSSDFGYDELWSQPSNQVGVPPNRPIEPMRIGSVLPEQNNFNFTIPIYGLSGRGMGAGVALKYNSRVWARHGTAVTYNPVNGFPFAGFSLGFGRIFTYGSGANTKYVLISADAHVITSEPGATRPAQHIRPTTARTSRLLGANRPADRSGSTTEQKSRSAL
jgi:hypothetical protein